MKFKINTSEVISVSRNTLKRFPLAVAVSVIATVLLLIKAGVETSQYDELFRWILACILGFPVFISLRLYSECHNHSLAKNWIIQALAGLAIMFYGFALPPTLMPEYISTRIYLFTLAAALLISFAGLKSSDSDEKFWNFNSSIFLRLLLSILFTLILFGGLSLALLAIDQLFGMRVESENYLRLFIFLSGIIAPFFFLSGIPETENLPEESKIPKSLKVFSLYILFPLLLVYFIILYIYGCKILITWKLPQGWVAWLVSIFTSTGILSFVLMHPLLKESATLRRTWKAFFVLVIPLLVLLFVSIYHRIFQYGITVNRYLLAFFAIWFFLISLLFLLRKQQHISIIPKTLFIILLLSATGPWGAISVSRNSQLQQFDKQVKKLGLLKNGQFSGDTIMLEKASYVKLATTLEYLGDVNGLKKLQPYFNKNLDSLFRKEKINSAYVRVQTIKQLMGIFLTEEENNPNYKNLYFYSRYNDFADIKGYSALLNIDMQNYNWKEEKEEEEIEIKLDVPEDKDYRLLYHSNNNALIVLRNQEELLNQSLNPFIQQVIKCSRQNFNPDGTPALPPDAMTYHLQQGKFSASLNLKEFRIDYKNHQFYIRKMTGFLLLR